MYCYDSAHVVNNVEYIVNTCIYEATALWKHIHGKHFYDKFGLGYVRGKNYRIYHECEDVSEKFFGSSTLGITRRAM